MNHNSLALVDCNNFYTACQVLFEPQFAKRPVGVLSSNDANLISRSPELKALGIPMGAPLHQVQPLVQQKAIKLYSSNFSLYGDLSARVMSTLSQFSSKLEVFSVDEAFLDFSAVAPEALEAYALKIKQTVRHWLGLPVSLGVAGTKTLAKLANKAAKQGQDGVLALQTEEEIDAWLAQTPVEDVWGIGPAHAAFLQKHRITTALQLKHAPERWIKQHLHLPGLRTVLELRGVSCIPLEEAHQPKKQIAVTRSFGRVIDSLHDLRETVAFYVTRAAEKLRQQHSLVGVLSVFIATNPFQPELPQYTRSCSIHLSAPTNDTAELIAAALGGLKHLYRAGYSYYVEFGLLHAAAQAQNPHNQSYERIP